MKKQPPRLIETKSGWKVTNGWVGDSYFEVVKQPSEETLMYLHEVFCEIANRQKLSNKREEVS